MVAWVHFPRDHVARDALELQPFERCNYVLPRAPLNLGATYSLMTFLCCACMMCL